MTYTEIERWVDAAGYHRVRVVVADGRQFTFKFDYEPTSLDIESILRDIHYSENPLGENEENINMEEEQ